MQKTFPYDSAEPISADLELPAGLLEVRQCSDATIEVSLEPMGRSSARAEEAIEASTVAFDGRHLKVHVPGRMLRNAEVRMIVALPQGSATTLKTASADVSVEVDVSKLDARTASGDIVGRNVLGDALATTASGDVRLERVTGRLDVRSASGDVRTDEVGGEVSAVTASGDVNFGGLERSAKIRTASGDVTIGSAATGEISVATASGDVAVAVAQGRGAWLDLITTAGDTTCSLNSEPLDEAAADLRLSCRTTSGDIRVLSAAR